MIVRGEQLRELSHSMRASFEARMLVHLKTFFPAQCEALGEEKIVESVHHGIERAAEYGIIVERDVCKYVDLMYALGRDFDKDPSFPWAHEDHTNSAIPDPTSRINRVHDAALTRIREQERAASPLFAR